MLDINIIRKESERVKKKAIEKGIDPKLVDDILSVDKDRSKILKELETAQKLLNIKSKDIATLHGQQKIDAINEASQYSEKVKKLKPEAEEIEKEFSKLMWQTPQLHADDAPIGKDSSGNIEKRRWGEKSKFSFKPKDHIELGELLDIIDFERGVKIHGFRGYFLKNEGAILHLALLMYAISKMVEKGYTPFIPPTVVKEFTLYGSGQFPFGYEETYKIGNSGKFQDGKEDRDNKYLVGTAEVPMVSYHSGEVLDEKDLPKKYCAYSPCFRSEVGSYGKDTKGIYRIHEFMKIEQMVICENDYKESEKYHQEITAIAEEIVKELGIPYRVMEICSGDMGAGKYRMYDIESWMPGRDEYGETHSSSNLGDWQARRVNLKCKNRKGVKEYVHMLNNTALASPRIIIALIENFQEKDGTINIPAVLHKYTGFKKISPKS
jgi:seryl-tRNA synthetase